MIRLHTWLLASALLALASVPSTFAQQPQGPWPLAGIQVEGAQRYAVDEVIRLTGLTIRQPVSVDQLQQLTNTLAATGLFREIGVSYTGTPDGLMVTLRIEEPDWSLPLVFDNNIWMTDETFTRAMAEHVPGFDDTAVEGGVANAFIATAAERVLADRGVTGRADFQLRFDVQTQTTTLALVMRETTESVRVCHIEMPGASALPRRLVDDTMAPLIGRDYSRIALASAVGTLQQTYRQRGHWRATTAAPTFTPATGACNGVVVTLAVTEGTTYTTGGARWVDATAIPAGDLDRALNLRVGSTPDTERLNDGLAAVERLYHARGYVVVATGVTAEFDDRSRQLTFVIQVQEGPQFRMGAITTEHLTDRQARDITGRWRLKQGDVFDGVYYREFVARETQRLDGRLRADARLDPANAVVTVVLSGIE